MYVYNKALVKKKMQKNYISLWISHDRFHSKTEEESVSNGTLLGLIPEEETERPLKLKWHKDPSAKRMRADIHSCFFYI